MPPPDLFLDRRAQLDAAGPRGPRTHALVVGVSSYPHLRGGACEQPDTLGMGQLTSCARSAERMVAFLAERGAKLGAPLATCRVLLSPSAHEADTAAPVPRATLDNFLHATAAWREDARQNPEDVTLFYFAGHGAQRSGEDSLLLFEDFLQPPGGKLRNATDTLSLFNGMAPSPSSPNIARTQIYFIDACRMEPPAFARYATLQATATFDVERSGRDDRCAPIFYAAVPNDVARAVPRQGTIFSEVLLHCLRSSAADRQDLQTPDWTVTVYSLADVLARQFQLAARRHGGAYDYDLGGHVKDAVLHRLDGAPEVDVTLEVDPALASQVGALAVRDEHDRLLHESPPPLDPHPWSRRLAAGTYAFNLTFPVGSGYANATRLAPLLPLRGGVLKVKVR